MIRYRLGIAGADHQGVPRQFYPSRHALRQRALKHGGPVRVARRGDEYGPKKTVAEGVRSLYRRIRGGPVGEVYFLRTGDSTIFRVHKIDVAPPVTNTQGNDKIDKIYSAVMDRFDGVLDYGICNCRHIDGSSTWSQHSWCNAWDIGAHTSREMDAIARFLVANRAEFSIEHVLWQGQDQFSHNPVDDHFDHVHVDCAPNGTGTPPCAR